MILAGPYNSSWCEVAVRDEAVAWPGGPTMGGRFRAWFAVEVLVLSAACAGQPDEGRFTEVIEYTIEKGDTLRELAVNFYHDAEKWVIIQNANADLDPRNLQPGDRILVPVTSATKAWWEAQAAEPVHKVVEKALAAGWSPQTVRALRLSLGIGFWLLMLLNFCVGVGMLMWLGARIARIPNTSFGRATLCTLAELITVVVLYGLIAHVLNLMSDSKNLAAAAASPVTGYATIAVLIFADLIVLRIMYRVGWLRSLALSLSRIVAMIIVCATIFGIASILTVAD